ncbi:hypothetical protein ACD661_15220 [Legionella lytica]|uniref:F-box domain-containing protein n=1 Tax=Legionella lytica TaxID=96232 RepID=A0ABW8DF99_9GAMM
MLPTEIIAFIFTYVDGASLQACRQVIIYRALADLELEHRLQQCIAHQRCNFLINKAALMHDLSSGVLDVAVFYNSVHANNVEKLAALLFPNEKTSREFLLYLPSYEDGIPKLGPYKRTLYWTEQEGRDSLLNKDRVKHWMEAKIAINQSMFIQLYEAKKISYENAISPKQIISNNLDLGPKTATFAAI